MGKIFFNLLFLFLDIEVVKTIKIRKEGFFPLLYVKKIEDPKFHKKVQAKYSYKAKGENELNVNAGDGT